MLIRIKGLSLDYNWFDGFREDIISYFLVSRVSIAYPLFLELLIISYSDIGSNERKIDFLIKNNIIEEIINLIKAHRKNSIILSRSVELLRVIFMNTEH